MPVFTIENKRVLFVHIPKTGGTSIEQWMEKQSDKMEFYRVVAPDSLKVSPQHMPKEDIDTLIDNNYNYSFAIVRNPYDRIESEFFYRQKIALDSSEHKTISNSDFSNWLLSNITKFLDKPFHLDNHFRAQKHFIDDTVKIFKFEHGLGEIKNKLADDLGLDNQGELPHKKKSTRTDVVWSRRARYKFNQLFASDFEYFDYQMVEVEKRLMDTIWDSYAFIKLAKALGRLKKLFTG